MVVSNVSLLLGFAGSGAGTSVVRLAGLAGAVAGAISMAAGEWVSVTSQNDLIERELNIQRRELQFNVEHETAELAAARYESHGMAERAAAAAEEVMRRPDAAVAVHAREQFRRRPRRSAFGDVGGGVVADLLPVRGVHARPAALVHRWRPDSSDRVVDHRRAGRRGGRRRRGAPRRATDRSSASSAVRSRSCSSVPAA